jgi:hypothetical protein
MRAVDVQVRAVLAGLAACTFSPGGGRPAVDDASVSVDASDGDGAVTIDAAIDAPGTSADACTAVCVGDDVMSCGAVVEACAAGCSTTGGAHCKQLVPSNGVTIADDLTGADVDLVLMADRLYTFDTDTGEIRHYPLDGSGGGAQVRAGGVSGLDPVSLIRWRVVAQPAPPASRPPPALAIFGVRSLSIPENSVLRPIGTRAAVLVARGTIQVAGEIDVGGGRLQSAQGGVSRTTPGPGGGQGAFDAAVANAAQGCAPGGNGSRVTLAGNQQRDTGGGGGGLGTAGGKGGPAQAQGVDGGGAIVAAGLLATVCAQTNLVPLRGGSGGGCSRDAGGGDVTRGGGGGGALQLTSFTAIEIQDGSLYAGGAGGLGDGEAAGSGADGGGAGGSGGSILLEAPSITVMAGSITATGGGGGAGHDDATAGQNGQRTGDAAQPSGNGGRGATGGGVGESLALDGTGDLDGTGGGGGGAGLVHLRSVRAAAVSGGPILRPAPSTSTAATTD